MPQTPAPDPVPSPTSVFFVRKDIWLNLALITSTGFWVTPHGDLDIHQLHLPLVMAERGDRARGRERYLERKQLTLATIESRKLRKKNIFCIQYRQQRGQNYKKHIRAVNVAYECIKNSALSWSWDIADIVLHLLFQKIFSFICGRLIWVLYLQMAEPWQCNELGQNSKHFYSIKDRNFRALELISAVKERERFKPNNGTNRTR